MTAVALIPRVRHDRDGHIVAIRCATCRTWRKPGRFGRYTQTCRHCPYGKTGRYLATHTATRR